MYSLKPGYITQIQKPHFCAMACLNMILYRQYGIIYEQEELGLFFDINIEPTTVHAFENIFGTNTAINDDEGFVTIESETLINHFFKEKNISLKAEAFHLNRILNDYNSLQSFIEKNIEQNNDLWVEYKVGAIWEGFQGMHDGLIESINGNQVVITNPDKDDKNRYTTSIDHLQDALSDRIARETGIVVITKV